MDEAVRRRDSVARALAEFIVTGLGWDGDTRALLEQDAVRLPEILDSAQLLELAGYLEDEFGVVVEDEEITAERFRSVHELAEAVVTKQDSRRAGL
jgi:acyl carrier protein